MRSFIKKAHLVATRLVCVMALVGCEQAVQPDANAAAVSVTSDPPNIVVLIADDMGWGDIGAFGSEIETPNIDRLAREGMSFTNFHAGATCSPTRSMLISGVDNHRTGLGNMHEIMADNQFGKPGYEGYLNQRVVSIATVLGDNGYNTYMAGKWHLGGTPESIPHAHGFKRSFALAESGADNWVEMPYAPMYERVHYFQDEQEVSLPTDNYFSSDFYTQTIIDYIEADREDDKPFLVWLGYQAVHYPHQAPKSFIDKYNGVYDNGWAALRESRFERQKAMGLIDEGAELDRVMDKSTLADWRLPDWDVLSEEEKRFNARRMQTYAGMLDNMDTNIGKLFDYLQAIGEWDNTIIVFLADNGADPNQLPLNPAYRKWYNENYDYVYIDDYAGDYSSMGQKGAYADYGPGWATAANTPNAYFKTYSTEGGVAVPFIAWYPKAIAGGARSDAFMYVKDVFTTLLDAVDVPAPGNEYAGRSVHAPDGTSAWPLLTGDSTVVHGPEESVGYELAGSVAVYRGDLKLSRNPSPKGTGEWELYDIVKDPGETNNMAAAQPDLVAELARAYEDYKAQNDVVEVPEGYDPIKQLIKNSAHSGH
jgi:arylsulfatase A-like enzyme